MVVFPMYNNKLKKIIPIKVASKIIFGSTPIIALIVLIFAILFI